MAPYGYRPTNQGLAGVMQRLQPGIAFVVMIFGALIAFEIFNYSTTEHALNDLLGNLTFLGIPWATMLALAFCGIDFAGIARLFTPEQGADEPKEVWYLFGAWLLAATMNAILTWWGVSMAVASHTIQSATVMDPGTVSGIVPVFVAVLVWLIRILIIGTLSTALDRMMHSGEQRVAVQAPISSYPTRQSQPQQMLRPSVPAQPMNLPAGLNSGAVSHRPSNTMSRSASPARPAPRPIDTALESDYEPAQAPEPTYHSLSMGARPAANRPGTNPNPGNGPDGNPRRLIR